MKIYGAGMAGLLAANLLRRHKPIILEKQPSLPNNHEALLRFRSDAISRLTGIPFRKVTVYKAIWAEDRIHNSSNLKFANMYAQKVTDKIINRSILKLEPAERWIAPPDFIQQLAASCSIQFDNEVRLSTELPFLGEPIISTLPMPILMTLSDWPKPEKLEFKAKPIWIFTADIVDTDCDIFQTIYFPEHHIGAYRASITGSKLIVEMISNPLLGVPGYCAEKKRRDIALDILDCFGIRANLGNIQIKQQAFGKIVPIDESLRKQFIMGMTNQSNIYSLGRFATWRNLLLDDLVKDIEVINDFVTTKDHYQRTLSATHK